MTAYTLKNPCGGLDRTCQAAIIRGRKSPPHGFRRRGPTPNRGRSMLDKDITVGLLADLRQSFVDAGVPYGFCQCGCGRLTNVSKVTRRSVGHVKGEPTQWIAGHSKKSIIGSDVWDKLRQSFEDAGVPYGHCQCGCGGLTALSLATYRAKGYIKGQPCRFVTGHATQVPVERRFWNAVDKRAPDECWPWTRKLHKGDDSASGLGYGRLLVDGRIERAHRVSYMLFVGPIPDELCVLHRCDNPPCVNPAHLFLGTRADNNADRDAKGRSARKLTWAQVQELRANAASGMSPKVLAGSYGVSLGHAGKIVRGGAWHDGST